MAPEPDPFAHGHHSGCCSRHVCGNRSAVDYFPVVDVEKKKRRKSRLDSFEFPLSAEVPLRSYIWRSSSRSNPQMIILRLWLSGSWRLAKSPPRPAPLPPKNKTGSPRRIASTILL